MTNYKFLNQCLQDTSDIGIKVSNRCQLKIIATDVGAQKELSSSDQILMDHDWTMFMGSTGPQILQPGWSDVQKKVDRQGGKDAKKSVKLQAKYDAMAKEQWNNLIEENKLVVQAKENLKQGKGKRKKLVAGLATARKMAAGFLATMPKDVQVNPEGVAALNKLKKEIAGLVLKANLEKETDYGKVVYNSKTKTYLWQIRHLDHEYQVDIKGKVATYTCSNTGIRLVGKLNSEAEYRTKTTLSGI